ncbi:MAG: GNAT family N-acetyltransferase [Undibacterium curvum]|uniref:GNAT family N-acetyltransferase n=1 Tax=Undibacterium curvum TaxID=2762294 RepID=UPI003BC5E394
MKFSIISFSELDAGLISSWHRLQQTAAVYDSPYFHPRFSQLVAQQRADARLLVMEEAGQVTGLFPYHQLAGQQLNFIGEGLSDYQGVLHAPDVTFPMSDLLRAMGKSYLAFDHVPAVMQEFASHAWTGSRSLCLNLDGGYAAYGARLAATREAGLLKKVETNARKLGQRVGDVRFEFSSVDAADFQALLDGKSQQFVRTLGPQADIFAIAWIRQLMEGIQAQRGSDFAGVLSVLYAGDKLVAAHFGMRSANTLHYWFPWYDTQFGEYSPGLILLARCAEYGAAEGITLIDLGRGEQAYKQRFATGFTELCEGAVSRPALLAKVHGGLWRGKRYLRDSALGVKLKAWRKS